MNMSHMIIIIHYLHRVTIFAEKNDYLLSEPKGINNSNALPGWRHGVQVLLGDRGQDDPHK